MKEQPYTYHHRWGTLTVYAVDEREAKAKAIRAGRGAYMMSDREYKEARE